MSRAGLHLLTSFLCFLPIVDFIFCSSFVSVKAVDFRGSVRDICVIFPVGLDTDLELCHVKCYEITETTLFHKFYVIQNAMKSHKYLSKVMFGIFPRHIHTR